MTAEEAITTVTNIAFAIVIWFTVPIVLPAATALGVAVIILNSLFSLGIALGILSAYAKPQE